MLIHIRVKDKRFDAGFKSVFYHENDINQEIYKFVKKQRDKILTVDFNGNYYFHNSSPNITDFLFDYRDLEKEFSK